MAFQHTPETRAKLSALRKGTANPFYGRKHSDAFKAALSARAKSQNALRRYEIRPRRFPDLTDTEAAYLAGLVDGEGSISSPVNRKGVTVTVYNTNVDVMSWLRKVSGLPTYERPPSAVAKVQAREPCHVWTVSSAADVFWLLKRLRPYLIIKASKADAMISGLLERYGERLNG